MRILVVEDDQPLAKGLRAGLAEAGFAVDVAGRLERATFLSSVNDYDAIVLDLGLPDGDGRDWLAAARAKGNSTPVLVLTARGTVTERVEGLNAGADDYLHKPFALPELVARIRALLRRPSVAVAPVVRFANLEFDPARFELRSHGQTLTFTAKEVSLVEFFLRHRGLLVTRSMLLDHCWDDSYDGLSNLVDVHVSRVRRKLEQADAGCTIRTVRGAGFVLEEPSE